MQTVTASAVASRSVFGHWCCFSLGIVAAIGVVAPHQNAMAADPYLRARVAMVRQHVAAEGVKDPRVLESMRRTLRHEFMATGTRDQAYYDMAVPIGYGQTISPPYIVAFMTEQLETKPTDRVLEIGTGSGYQAAILSPLVKEVYTIEIVEPLGRKAAETLKRLGYENVFPKVGDGFKGWPEHAPFDKIIITCSPEDIPKPLVEQLAEGGQMVIPVGERFQQTLCRFRKVNGELEREPLQATFFVPMTGVSEDNREIKPDKSNPSIVAGSFEETLGETDDPEGWYYVREAAVTKTSAAPDGEHVVVFENKVPGRSAHALQAFGVDGVLVRELTVSLWTKGKGIRPGQRGDQSARVVVEFYNETRKPVGHLHLGPWKGTFDWTKRRESVDVPPTASLAVIGVGLFGATGTLAVDQVTVGK